MEFEDCSADWKLNSNTQPRIVLSRLPRSTLDQSLEREHTMTQTTQVKDEFSSYLTRQEEMRNELNKIISDCDSQCEVCCSLVRKLTNHVAKTHLHNKKSWKRKRNGYDETMVLPPVEVETDKLPGAEMKSKSEGNANQDNEDQIVKFEENETEQNEMSVGEVEAINIDSHELDPQFTPDGDESDSIANSDNDSESEVEVESNAEEKDSSDSDSSEFEIENKLMCGICKQVFSTLSDLRQHVGKIHQIKKLYKCHECGLDFDLRTKELNHHFELFHPEHLAFACEICTNEPKMEFSTLGELLLHEKSVHRKTKIFPCDQCEKVFDSKYRVERHSKVHSRTRKPHICSKCGWSFNTLEELEGHKTIHLPKKNFVCEIEDCWRKFTAKVVLDAHVRLAHSTQKSDTDTRENSNSDDKDETKEIEKSKPFVCLYCTKPKAFFKETDLEGHLRRKHKYLRVKEFPCYVCKSKFQTTSRRQQHMRNEHSNHKPYGCQICSNKEFADSGKLLQHVRKEHIREKTFVCPYCQMRFLNRHGMQKHVANRHTGEKAFKCDYEKCGKGYNRLYELLNHKKVTHEGQKEFVCEECGKLFGTKQGLYNHSVFHKTTPDGEPLKPYVCQEKDCEARFATRGNLASHALSHSTLKPHMCPQCGKQFKLPHQIKRHLKTHLKQKTESAEIA